MSKEMGFLKLLSEIKKHKATGPDRIPDKYLKECALEIVDAYFLLFQTSTDQEKVPHG